MWFKIHLLFVLAAIVPSITSQNVETFSEHRNLQADGGLSVGGFQKMKISAEDLAKLKAKQIEDSKTPEDELVIVNPSKIKAVKLMRVGTNQVVSRKPPKIESKSEEGEGPTIDLGELQKAMEAFYQKHAPEKVKDVSTLIKKYAGAELDMVKKIELKYSDKFPPFKGMQQ